MYVEYLSTEEIESYILSVTAEDVIEHVRPIITSEAPSRALGDDAVVLLYPQHHLNIIATDKSIMYKDDYGSNVIAKSAWRNYVSARYYLMLEKVRSDDFKKKIYGDEFVPSKKAPSEDFKRYIDDQTL